MSALFQSIAGDERATFYTVTKAQLPTLTTASSAVVRLTEPGTDYLPRVNSLDMTLAGTVRAGKLQIKPEVAIFNVFNDNTNLKETFAFPTQGTVLGIVPGRMVRLGIQVYF